MFMHFNSVHVNKFAIMSMSGKNVGVLFMSRKSNFHMNESIIFSFN